MRHLAGWKSHHSRRSRNGRRWGNQPNQTSRHSQTHHHDRMSRRSRDLDLRRMSRPCQRRDHTQDLRNLSFEG